jgi:Cu-processing system permease protein
MSKLNMTERNRFFFRHQWPTTWAVTRAVGFVTMWEILRDRVLYNILICSGFLLGIAFLASHLTFIRPERVVLDFGMSATGLSCAMIAIFSGSGLIAKEFDRRTIHVALCRPITRVQFILGKFFGLSLVISLNWAILSSCYLAVLILYQNGITTVSATLILAIGLLLLQSFVLASLAVFFSSFTTASLSVIFTTALYFIGCSISHLQSLVQEIQSSYQKMAFWAAVSALPNFEYFSLGFRVTYGLPVELRFIGISFLYAVTMITFFLTLAGICIRSRDV